MTIKPEAQKPEDLHITYDSGPDDQGRKRFTLFWLVPETHVPQTREEAASARAGSLVIWLGKLYRRRAQCFFANPQPYTDGTLTQGVTARVGVPRWMGSEPLPAPETATALGCWRAP